MSSTKPIIVFVPGSFAPPPIYAIFADHVRFYGYEIEILNLPSIGRRDPQPPATMADDAAYIAAATKQYVDAGKPVVLVAHSYGGIPAAESLKGLTAKERGAGNGGVEKMIYVTALATPVGSSLHSLVGDVPVSYVKVQDDGYMKQTDFAEGGAISYSSLPPDEQYEQAKRAPEHSVASFVGELTHAGYLDVPVTYLLATQDKTLPPVVQEKVIQIMKDAGANVTVERFDSDHCWNASVPRSTAKKVLKVIDPTIG